MCRRAFVKFRPVLEPFEVKQLLSAGSLTTRTGITNDSSGTAAQQSVTASRAEQSANATTTSHAQRKTQTSAAKPAPPGAYGFLAFRVTNTPFQTPYNL